MHCTILPGMFTSMRCFKKDGVPMNVGQSSAWYTDLSYRTFF